MLQCINDEAIEHYTFSLKTDPYNQFALMCRALTFLQNEQYDDAITDYTNVIKTHPANAEAVTFRGYCNPRQPPKNIQNFDASL